MERELEGIDALALLWQRERAATRERFVEIREDTSLDDRVELGLAIRKARIEDEDAAPGGRTLLWLGVPADQERVFRPGSPVRMHNESGEVRGVVSRRRASGLGVVVEGEFVDALDGDSFAVDADAPDITFARGDAALAALRSGVARAGKRGATPEDEANGTRASILFGDAPLEGHDASFEVLDEALNEAQRDAVAHALGDIPIALIHGPPGTGKTRTLVEVVRQLVARGERVLVTAASNAAVDHLGERLVEAGAPVLRLGHPARVSESLQPETLDAKIEATAEWKLTRQWQRDAAALHHTLHQRAGRGRIAAKDKRALFAEARGLRRDARVQLDGAKARIVAAARVVLSTAAGADASLLSDERFDVVVLDEATQAPDPIALVALSRAPRAVLAGDPQQLPPTVIDRQAQSEGLGETFFERLARRAPGSRRLLVVQHRMNEAIMSFPNEAMYDGRLVAAPAVAKWSLADLGAKDDEARPGAFLFIDTAGKGWDEERQGAGRVSGSILNEGSAAFVCAEVQRALRRGLAQEDIAIITPYAAQVQLLRRLLRESELSVDVGTVDGFQGQEREVILVDLVRSNADGDIGFLADTRRMNVALTRAKRLLVVVGDGATLGEYEFYKGFLDAATAGDAYRSVWDDEG